MADGRNLHACRGIWKLTASCVEILGFGMTTDSSDEGHFDVAIALTRMLPAHQDATGPKFPYLALSEIIFMSRVICKSQRSRSNILRPTP